MSQNVQEQKSENVRHRSFLGLRVSALLETIAFLAAALLLDEWLGAGDRFSDLSPHPFWIIVLLVSTYYGTNEGLAAAALCAIAALAGHVPDQGFNEERTAWLLRVTADPVLWIMAALILGEIRSGQRHRYEALKGEFENSRRQVTAITSAYEMLAEVKRTLEVRIAAQVQTVQSVYRAGRSIDRHRTGDVLAGIPDLVRTIMVPRKFSLFLLDGSTLTVAASDGWRSGDGFLREFDPTSPLFQAVVTRQQLLLISDQSHELTLAGQGILAGPLVHPDTGATFGMLKIDQIGFTGLNPSTVQNFRTLCEWIGSAYANAEHIERLKARHAPGPTQQFLPGTCYDGQRAGLSDLAQEACFDACAFYASFVPEPGSTAPDEALIAHAVLCAAGEILTPDNFRFNFKNTGWTYAILLPGYDRHMADKVAQRFSRHVCGALAEHGYSVRSRYLVEILHRKQREARLTLETDQDAQQQA